MVETSCVNLKISMYEKCFFKLLNVNKILLKVAIAIFFSVKYICSQDEKVVFLETK